jgi:hypothetical protein
MVCDRRAWRLCASARALPAVQYRITYTPLKRADLAIRRRQVLNGRGLISRREGDRFVVVATGAERSDPTATGSAAATWEAMIATRYQGVDDAP